LEALLLEFTPYIPCLNAAFDGATSYWSITSGYLLALNGSFYDQTNFTIVANGTFSWNSTNTQTSDGIRVGYGQINNSTNQFYGGYSLRVRFFLAAFSATITGSSHLQAAIAPGQYTKDLGALVQVTYTSTLQYNLACPCNCFGNNGSLTPTQFVADINTQNDVRSQFGLSTVEWITTLQDFAGFLSNNCSLTSSPQARITDQLIFEGLLLPTTTFSPSRIQQRLEASLSWLAVNYAAFPSNNVVTPSDSVWLAESRFYDCPANACVGGPCDHYAIAASSIIKNVGCNMTICPGSTNPFNFALNQSWVLYVCVYEQLPGDAFTRPFPVSQCS